MMLKSAMREFKTQIKGKFREQEAKLKGELREQETGLQGELILIKWMLAVVVAVTVLLPALKTLLG
ncbi:MAG: hypothetical protein H7833_09195 [Magnetococcus sp. DMHC-1]|nr:hypothetical protein [Magnetococcales bacterium]